jgi:iron complex transport system substrate-binding protein
VFPASRPVRDRSALSRRGLLAGALGVTAAGLTGCSTSGSADPTVSAKPAAGFPVTVPGKLGKTTVTAAPKRVVAAGYLRDTDLALALGAPLVGVARNVALPGGIAPWQHLKGSPTLFDATDGVPAEKVAALRPDLILASDDYTLAKDYAKLSGIAPTLGYTTAPGQDDWTEMTRRAGAVLGRRKQADALVAKVKGQVADARKKLAGAAGKTFAFGPVSSPSELYVINSAKDASAVFLSQLGLTISPKVTKLPTGDTPQRASVSPERLDVLDADVLILTYLKPDVRQKVEANPLFRRLDVVRRGAYIALDMTTAIAIGFPSALSIPYGLNAVTPKLAKALSA